MSREPLTPDDPQRIGPYWLVSRLGAGGQGVVYEAYDSAGARCVVKVLRAESAADDFARSRFRKEAEAAQQVDSFCTARVLHADAEADPPYLVSELINGRDLQAVVREDGPVGGDALVRLATGIATALTAIHAASVVHRDLKPGNVLLGPDGPRVIDFGIARTQDMSLTETGKMMGTPGYMAPEVLRGRRADGKSDVFAWGAVVLFAATGRAPFHGENLGEIVVRVTELEPDLAPLPERLRPLVGAALSKDPAARPTSSELLLRLLTGAGGGAGFRDRAPGPGIPDPRAPGSWATDPRATDSRTPYWPPAPETRAAGLQGAALPAADLPTAGVPAARLPTVGVPAAGLPAADLPAAELLARGARAAAHHPGPPSTAPGVTDALPEWGAVAERVFTSLDPAARAGTEELLLRLVVPGDAPDGSQDGVRTAAYDELLEGRPAHEKAALRQALDSFAAVGVLVHAPVPHGSVRLVGAALHRAWPRLRALTAEHRDGLRVLRRTGDAARAWDRAGQHPDHLQHGGMLRAALDQAATAPAVLRPSRLERAFLAASRAHESRRQRQRNRLRGGIAVLLVTALVAGGIAWQLQRTNAAQQALSTARNVASVADGMRASDPETAALLSIAAWRIAPADEARGALYQSAWQRETAVFQDPTKEPLGLETGMDRMLSDDGRVLVTEVSEALGRKLYRFDTRTGEPLPVPKTPPGTLSSDGRFMMAGEVVRSLDTGKAVGKVPGAGDGTDAGDLVVQALSSGGRRALVTGADPEDTGFTVVDTRTGSTLLRASGASATQPGLSGDGRYLVSCPPGGDPVLHDVGHGGARKLRGLDSDSKCGDATTASFSADSSKLVVLTGGYLSTWNTSTGKLLSTGWPTSTDAAGEPVEYTTVRMSPDGGLVAATGSGVIDVTRSGDLRRPLLTRTTDTQDEDGLQASSASLALDSESHALRYLDGNAVHTLDLSFTDLPRRAANDVSHYGPKAASLLTAHTVHDTSRIRTWALASASDADDPKPPAKTHDFPSSARGRLGTSLGEDDLPSVLSPDGTTLAYPRSEPEPGKPLSLVLQDTHTGKVRRTVALSNDPDRGRILSLAFSRDSRTLAVSRSAADNHESWSVDVIDTTAPPGHAKARTLEHVGGYGLALGGSGDDLVLVTTSGDRVDLRTGKTTRNALGNTDLYAVAFSPDGKTLAVSDPTGVALWNADATQRLGHMPGPLTEPLRFSPDGRFLAGVSSSEQLQFWDVSARRPLGDVLPGIGDTLHDVAFDARGNLHVAGQSIRSYTMPLTPDALAARICARLNRPKNLTRAEWQQNIPDTPYQRVCD